MNSQQRRRCAIYTRKSNAAGLDKEFNSLTAQREVWTSYIASQRTEGLVELDTLYDDGGFSGGTMERPAFKRLMADIGEGHIEVVIVYKIDRLSRSLRDFVKIVEAFEQRQVTFISVTQSFNTTSSMGRLIFNVLLSFAQFEREMTSDRLKDKFASLRAKGLWTGPRPLGYRTEKLRLIVDQGEADLVRLIYRRYVALRSGRAVANELTALGHVSQFGGRINAAFVLRHVRTRLYRGELVHRGQAVPGIHEPIVSENNWAEAQTVLAMRSRKGTDHRRPPVRGMLKGLIFGPTGQPLFHTYTKGEKGKLYRYYVLDRETAGDTQAGVMARWRASDLEEVVLQCVQQVTGLPEAAVLRRVTAGPKDQAPTARTEREQSDRHLIVRLFVKRVDLRAAELKILSHKGESYILPLPSGVAIVSKRAMVRECG